LSRHSATRRHLARSAALIAVAALVFAGCGNDDDPSTASANDATDSGAEIRTVEIEMVDNAFEPAEVEVSAGETVRFVFANDGAVTHDAVIGDEAAQDEHEEDMRAAEEADEMGEMNHGATDDDEEGAVTVEPGETGELTHTFSAGDELLVGCHEPGHYDADMRISLNVGSA
jgi:uncharacterized cupredoxin-like copper-binding protein